MRGCADRRRGPKRSLARPAEVDEVRCGPPIGEDDVAAFVAALDLPDWRAELSA